MRHAILGFLIVAGMTAGCSKSKEEAFKDRSISLMSEMNDILSSITDPDSAKAAKPKMEALGKRVQALHSEFGDLEQPEAETLARYQAEMEPIQKELMSNMMRISLDPELSAVLKDTFDGMDFGQKQRPGASSQWQGNAPPGGGIATGAMPSGDLVDEAVRKAHGTDLETLIARSIAKSLEEDGDEDEEEDADESDRVGPVTAAPKSSALFGNLEQDLATLNDKSLPGKQRVAALMKVHMSTAMSKDKSAVTHLIAALDDPESDVRTAALTVLPHYKDSVAGAVPKLVKMLEDASADETAVRVLVIRTLGSLGPAAKDAIPALEKTAKAADPATRVMAEQALGQIRAAK